MDSLKARRLIVGCGDHYFEDWYCIDKYDLPHHKHSPDLIVDVLEGLPFPNESYDQVYCGHLLEHIPFDLVPSLVAECWRVLAPGGVLGVVGPCIELAICTDQPMWLLKQICANPTPEAPGLGHEWTPTGPVTLHLVRRGVQMAGGSVADVRMVPVAEVDRPEWPNPCTDGWQFALLGVKP